MRFEAGDSALTRFLKKVGLQNLRFKAVQGLRRLPFRAGISSLWPRTYLSYVPDRYGENNRWYEKSGGQFGRRYRSGFFRGSDHPNRGDMPRYYFLSLVCDQFMKERVTGDIAELGVFRGNTAFIWAALARQANRTAYLFDTFSGFSKDDLTGIDADKGPGFGDTSLEAVRALVGEDNVRYVQGHFPGTTSQLSADATFGLVHIDCDLYAPFQAALEYFYPRLVTGGFLIMHDYASLNWDGAEKAVDEFFADKPEKVIPIPDKSGTVVIRKI